MLGLGVVEPGLSGVLLIVDVHAIVCFVQTRGVVAVDAASPVRELAPLIHVLDSRLGQSEGVAVCSRLSDATQRSEGIRSVECLGELSHIDNSKRRILKIVFIAHPSLIQPLFAYLSLVYLLNPLQRLLLSLVEKLVCSDHHLRVRIRCFTLLLLVSHHSKDLISTSFIIRSGHPACLKVVISFRS